jgi:soluble lytic murein transglycosylase-like protein
MTVRLKRPANDYRLALQPAAGTLTGRGAFDARQALAIFAIGIAVFLAAMFFVPKLAGQEEAGADQEAAAIAVAGANFEGDAALQGAPAVKPVVPASGEHAGGNRQQQWVTDWLARRYRVANDAANMLVSTAYTTARENKIDPLLILAVMAIESGLNPFAESPVGAKGLMQVMAHVHQQRFAPLGGVKAALNPVANIKVGTAILKEYVQRGGSVEAGLKQYVGAAAFETDSGYGNRVMAEYRRLKDVSSGKKVPISFPTLVKRPNEMLAPMGPPAAQPEPTEAAAKPDQQVAAL